MRIRAPQFSTLLMMAALTACNVDLDAGGEEKIDGPGDGAGGSGAGTDPSQTDTASALVESEETGGDSGGSVSVENVCPGWTAGESVHGLAHPEGNTLASATYARDMLARGLAPNPERVRPQEFVNFYEAPYAATDGVTLFADLAPVGLDANVATTRYTLQIGLAAPPVELPPLSLTLVLDGSGSMAGEAETRQAAAVDAIASQLRIGDRVRIITFADEVTETLSLYDVLGPDDPALQAALPEVSEGDSQVTPALAEAFASATRDAANEPDAYLHRVMLMTDGAARLDEEDGSDVRALAASADALGVYVSAVSTGPTAGYDDSLIRAVSLDGRGSTVYLDDLPEADLGGIFRERFDELMGVAARDVTFELILPQGARLIVSPETQTEPGGGVRTAHLAVGDALVLQHEIELCSTDAAAYLEDISVSAHWFDAVDRSEQSDQVALAPAQAGQPDAIARISKVTALKAYADALRGPVPARLQAASSEIEAALGHAQGDADLEEVLSLLGSHPALTVAQ